MVCDAVYLGTRSRVLFVRFLVFALMGVHASLLALQSVSDAATWDEPGHFAGGVYTWRTGSFTIYRVNPPLVRLWATIPEATFTRTKVGPSSYWGRGAVGDRPEYTAGPYLAQEIGKGYFARVSVARIMCIPFSVLGAWVCFAWATELWGCSSGVLSLVLWAFSPSVLAYGHLIVPDVAAAALGILTLFVFRRWLYSPQWMNSLLVGVTLGLAELSKMTAVLFVAVMPLIWLAWRHSRPKNARGPVITEIFGILSIFVVALAVLNLGYGFSGTFRPLGKYQFVSEIFRGSAGHHVRGPIQAGNRFAGSVVGNIPVPLPEDYLVGLDLQRWDFEEHQWSYLNGEWRLGGWWYYYLYAMGVKEPVGLWLLALLANVAAARYSGYRALFREEILLLLPAIAIIGLVSSQTGFNHHVRYVLPAFPFIFISVSRVAKAFALKDRAVATVSAIAVGWFLVSSARVLPHSLSYFNELAGGPYEGHWHLGNSNADWGQDLLNIKRWIDAHPNAKPVHLAYDLPLIDPALAGIAAELVPSDERFPTASNGIGSATGPQPGWFVVSVNKLHDREHRFDYFNDLMPVDWVGYTMPVYHVSLDEANRLRRRYKLPEISAADAARAETELQIGR